MNCKECSELLFDYEDKALDVATHALVDSHLLECTDCRRLFSAESSAMHRLPNLLRQEMGGLTLSPETQDHICAMAKIDTKQSSDYPEWQKFAAKILVPIGVAAGFLFLSYSNLHDMVPQATSSVSNQHPANVAVWIPMTLSGLSNSDARAQSYDTTRAGRDTYPLFFACISNQELRMARNSFHNVQKVLW